VAIPESKFQGFVGFGKFINSRRPKKFLEQLDRLLYNPMQTIDVTLRIRVIRVF
jgi:hypothetical protein